jgi:hypothetical protein
MPFTPGCDPGPGRPPSPEVAFQRLVTEAGRLEAMLADPDAPVRRAAIASQLLDEPSSLQSARIEVARDAAEKQRSQAMVDVRHLPRRRPQARPA